jgi:hypothetical protein
MTPFSVPNTPVNRALAATVDARVRAETRKTTAAAAFWTLLGWGCLALLIGLGAGAACFGYATITDQRATTTLAGALADALRGITLKTDGTVTLDSTGSVVKLDSTGAVVRLDTKNTAVALDTRSATVRLNTSGAEMRPTEQQLGFNAMPKSNAKPVTDFTVFHTVDFGSGTVVTGWKFRSNEDTKPSGQFCYYGQASETDINMGLHYNIGRDGVKVPSVKGIPVNLDQAFANCVWFNQ